MEDRKEATVYKEKEFRERCAARGLGLEAVEQAVAWVRVLEAEAPGPDGTLASASLSEVERHVERLVARGEVRDERLLALARYFAAAGIEAVAIRLLAYLLPVGVLPAMADRLAELEGGPVRDRVMAGVAVPPTGAPPEVYPAATAAFVRALESELGAAKARRVLCWNVHGIPAAAFAAEREAFLASASLEEWLAAFHGRKVRELERHAEDGTLWFEQRITPAVVDFVRGNQEILSAVSDGRHLWATKIPYDPDRFLASKDPLEKRRLACHCPLAASSITGTGAGVPAAWCACSAGYEKFLFDTVFGEETEAEVTESVLAGDPRCRFRIRIPDSVLERFRTPDPPGSSRRAGGAA